MLRYIHVFQSFCEISTKAQSLLLEELTKVATDAFGDNTLIVSASSTHKAARARSAVARARAYAASVRSGVR